VIFRLTEQEHEALRRQCAAKGGRSLSEFVRTELLGGTHRIDAAALQEMVNSIERRLLSLEDRVGDLARVVGASNGSPGGTPPDEGTVPA